MRNSDRNRIHSHHKQKKIKVKVMLRLTVSHSVCLDVEPLLGLMTSCLLLFDDYCFVFVRRPL
jgi:hypothetical protein